MTLLPVLTSYVSYPLLMASGKGFNRTPHTSSPGPFTVTKPQWVEEGSSYEGSVRSPNRQLSPETGSRVELERLPRAVTRALLVRAGADWGPLKGSEGPPESAEKLRAAETGWS